MDDKQMRDFLERKGYVTKDENSLVEGAVLEGYDYNILKLRWEAIK